MTDEKCSPQQVFDLFSTAIEGGIGYWAETHLYQWQREIIGEDLSGFLAVISDPEDPDDDMEINDDVIRRGLRAAAAAQRLNPALRAQAVALVAGEEVDFDAELGDVVVQFGLFGEVVYG